MKILSNLAQQATTAAKSFDTTSSVGMFILKPIKVFSEFLSVLGTYENIKSLPSFTFLSDLTTKTKENLDGTFGILGVLKFTLNAPANLLQLKVQNVLKSTLGAAFDLKDTQEVFTSTKWTALPSKTPLSLISKALQWNISPQRLLLLGTLSGLWQIGDSLKKIQDWSSVTNLRAMENRNWKDVSYALTTLEAVTNVAYSCFKVLGYKSRAQSWIKFGLIAASTSCKIAAFLVKPSEEKKEASIEEFEKWLNPENQEEKDNLNRAFSRAVFLEARNENDETAQADKGEVESHEEFENGNSKNWNTLKFIIEKMMEKDSILNKTELGDRRNLSLMREEVLLRFPKQ